MSWPAHARPLLLVNPYSRVIHRPECVYAGSSIPRGVYQATDSDKPCRVCRPEVEEDGE